MREKILELLSGKKIDAQPAFTAFSGLIHITVEGLEREGLTFHEVHKDAEKMARAAASTFKLTGMPSATLPLDLCAPAEALGAELNYGEFQFPQVKRALVESVKEIEGLGISKLGIGRLPIICKAIELAKNDIGKDVVISGMIPGPYTLLLYLCNPIKLFTEMKKEPQAVIDALFHLSSFLAKIGNAYRKAGADYITIHEMGGSAGFIGAAKFEQFVLPALKDLHAKLPTPRVLSVCGNATKSLALLNQCGAEAISLDQTVDLTAARTALKDVLLFGNLDPIKILLKGDEFQIAEAVARAKEARVDSVWAGCDLALQTPLQNIKAWGQSFSE